MVVKIVLICTGLFIYFLLTYLWMLATFKSKRTLNYFIFRNELERNKKSFIHYVEVAAIILMLIGLLTTVISQIQILVNNKKRKNG